MIIFMFAHFVVLDVAFIGAVIAIAFKKNKLNKYVENDIQKGE